MPSPPTGCPDADEANSAPASRGEKAWLGSVLPADEDVHHEKK
jgi:hypothetical protein